ncbi:hypothetical protein MKX03_034879 [Papaver bracteatum]|nr:hypothetical protein MKX03_034879 [Papaver bracteatum]
MRESGLAFIRIIDGAKMVVVREYERIKQSCYEHFISKESYLDELGCSFKHLFYLDNLWKKVEIYGEFSKN